jgi:membrane fusion protein (multidrug efflux system)
LDSAVVLPSALVQQDVTGQDYVFVVGSEGTAEKRVVELGVGSGNEVLVERGLAWNEQVVEKGASRIVAGEQVRIIEQ